jgi:polysaccharide export outer membrane protein
MSFKHSSLGYGLIAGAVVFLAGCASQPSSSPEDIQKALADGPDSMSEDYVLGPTDVVTVSVWRNQDLSLSVPVRPDGKISVPLVGDVLANGRTPEQLAESVRASLTEFIREPQVSVVVTSMGSNEFTSRVRVTGAVRQSISTPHRQGMTVLDIFLSAGGANEFAALNDTRLHREMNGKVVSIPVRLEDILTDGDIETNYTIRPGDILAIPERNF